MMFSYHARLTEEQIESLAHEYLGVQAQMERVDDKIQDLSNKIIDENIAIQALNMVHHMLDPQSKRTVDNLVVQHQEKLDRLRASRVEQRVIFTMHAERYAVLLYHFNANHKLREKIKELRS